MLVLRSGKPSVSVPLPGFIGLQALERNESRTANYKGFSPVAGIHWAASGVVVRATARTKIVSVPLPGFIGLQASSLDSLLSMASMFQSRCRDSLGCKIKQQLLLQFFPESFSPVAGIHWAASCLEFRMNTALISFSPVAGIHWAASGAEMASPKNPTSFSPVAGIHWAARTPPW